eukprot:2855290-Rhodomonas_salina.2
MESKQHGELAGATSRTEGAWYVKDCVIVFMKKLNKSTVTTVSSIFPLNAPEAMAQLIEVTLSQEVDRQAVPPIRADRLRE